LVLVAVCLPFLIDANQFRPLLVSELSQALGRDVKVGDLKLSLLSGGISAADLSIADDPAFSRAPFVSAKSMKVSVDLWKYLTARNLDVKGITIQQPQIALLQNPSGVWNFSKLGANQSKTTSTSQLDLSIQDLKIDNGRLSMGTTGSNAKPVVLENLNLELKDFSATSIMPFTLSAKVAGGGSVKINGKAGSINQGDAVLTPVAVALTVTQLDLAGSGLASPASGFGGLVSFDGNASSNGQSLVVQGQVKADKLKVARNGGPAGRPVEFDFTAGYDLAARSARMSRGDVHLGTAQASLTGTFAPRGETTVLNMNLNGPNMPVSELEAMLPALDIVLPRGSSLQGGSAAAKLNVQGPTDRLVTTGAVGLRDTRLAGFSLGSALSTVAQLAGVQAGPNTDIKSCTASVRIAPEGVTADNLVLDVPALGQLTGAGTISASHALNFTMRATVRSAGGVMAALGQSGAATIPFFIQGTSSNPVFRPDVKGIAAANANRLQQIMPDGAKKATGILGGFLDGLKRK
jgi:AsmA protein